MGNLTDLAVRKAKPGRYSDGGGLILDVKESGARSWFVRVQVDGKRRDFGLGPYPLISLAEARTEALEFKKQFRAGIDPSAAKRALRAFKSEIPTYREAAITAHSEFKAGWRNKKAAAQWLSSQETYVFPAIGDLRVDAVDGPTIRDLMQPIWRTKAPTARRVLQRIGTVLDWAHAKGYRPLEAPTRSVLKGLGRQPKQDNHYSFVPYSEVPRLMRSLAERESVGRLALRFLILTAARSGEVRGATWDEVDLEKGTWTIPKNRMKAGKEHVVPLSPAATAILRQAAKLRTGREDEFIFPGQHRKKMSDMTLAKVLRTIRPGKETVHGFRSSFRVWAAEETDTPREIAEEALAHAIPNRVEGAYRRTDYLAKRRILMESWAAFAA
jgi:integrase